MEKRVNYSVEAVSCLLNFPCIGQLCIKEAVIPCLTCLYRDMQANEHLDVLGIATKVCIEDVLCIAVLAFTRD